jgi:hypothetical protein
MAKSIVPQKVIVDFDQDVFHSGVLFYKINEDGVISKLKSVGITDADFKITQVNNALKSFIAHAKQAEGIKEV